VTVVPTVDVANPNAASGKSPSKSTSVSSVDFMKQESDFTTLFYTLIKVFHFPSKEPI
jgi:hypothetical protein